ncbi:DUF4124 domain-containing protein [Xanthomonas citri pv. citri]|uniref:DUF4124 domain-containing protein n=1 Tax=Xanthomonas citri TaxID=346 RepID=UPI00052C95CC|nr:DUF4124 domain-containing protein [Xanthomonas citri]MBD4841256.1 DUF4124 domain-containing protein [Xanthomonas citri pv. citri]MBD4850592.1 DUF4124 domain-containing protein [Xanthomonas citri pv. citri]MBD4870855.1 DUF4124 domain-containing protein [Xanthomonas citri pv. citri]CEE37008.1 conserved exported hypothetical protein [Xanthomonas citri pv. citri]CEH48559.1 conserved exported hypothetical protein [Xanthomonas citri pv. citri]
MDARLAVFLMLAIAAPAYAQQVHKCRERGQVVYQSAPCASGISEKAWDATPEAEPTIADKVRLLRIDRELKARNAPSVGYATGATVTTSTSACESAKAQRKAAYDAAGLHRSFAMSSHWDNIVQAACK